MIFHRPNNWHALSETKILRRELACRLLTRLFGNNFSRQGESFIVSIGKPIMQAHGIRS